MTPTSLQDLILTDRTDETYFPGRGASIKIRRKIVTEEVVDGKTVKKEALGEAETVGSFGM